MEKKFILDTNVILHDSSCIHQFEDNHVLIPITVIEELDRFKKGNSVINANARDFLRSVDALSSDKVDKVLNGGARLKEGKGKVSICLEKEIDPEIKQNFKDIGADLRILNTAYLIAKENQFKHVTLVTKDVNLRLKARSVGIHAENYHSKYVENLSDMYTGVRVIDNTPDQVFDEIHARPYQVELAKLNGSCEPLANENIVLKNGSRSALACFNKRTQTVNRITTKSCYGVTPRNSEQIFALNAMLDPDIPLVTVSGKAGTGKTLLALAAALENKKLYRQIFIARPVVPLSNKDLGYLPGDISSKLDPYMQPLYDNLSVIQNAFSDNGTHSKRIQELIEEEKIVITPISFIRGRSIVKVFFIVDEAQNLTPHEVKTIITRAGEGTKIVFTGDIFQIDHPYLDSQTNGLAFIIEKMKNEPLYAHINLEKGERSELAELASKVL
ncbi:MAG: PhoH family protein [Desulfobacteraceae bacterium]|nr:MAG: PhoH family protein [Desulfobacteraceae bacterium]